MPVCYISRMPRSHQVYKQFVLDNRLSRQDLAIGASNEKNDFAEPRSSRGF